MGQDTHQGATEMWWQLCMTLVYGRLEVRLSSCNMDNRGYGNNGSMLLPDYLLLLLIFCTMLCSMCTVGLVRWRIQLMYPEAAPPVEENIVINLPQAGPARTDAPHVMCVCGTADSHRSRRSGVLHLP